MHYQTATYSDPVTRSRRTFLAIRIRPIGEQCLQELVIAAGNKVQQIFDEGIFILVRHSSDIIRNVTSIMFDQKLRSTGFEMWI